MRPEQLLFIGALLEVLVEVVFGIFYFVGWIEHYVIGPRAFMGMTIGATGFAAVLLFYPLARSIFLVTKNKDNELKEWNVYGTYFLKSFVANGLLMVAVVVWVSNYLGVTDGVPVYSSHPQQWSLYNSLFLAGFVINLHLFQSFLISHKYQNFKRLTIKQMRRLSNQALNN